MKKSVNILLAILMGMLIYSCASMGRPEGGARDENPPIFIKGTPSPNALNVTKNKVELDFNEYISLKDQNDKVVISPVQTEMPSIRAQGKKIVVEFRDSLIPNTTYSIDFSNAIVDYNEGNPLEGFAYAFSTGNTIDSLQIAGMVLNARDLEPQQKTLVGVHTILDDTAFTNIPLVRIARTNDRGQFVIRNLKAGKYRLFAINDVDRDNKFANPNEDIAFYDSIIEPYASRKLVMDTLFTINHKIDTIVEAMHTTYHPNDILLSMFNEEFKSQYLVKQERLSRNRFQIIFSAPSDTLPVLEFLENKNLKNDWYILDHSKHNDTLTYWIKDKEVLAMDTIPLEVKYLRNDTANNLVWGTDTLSFNLRKVKAPKKKEKEDTTTTPKLEFLKFSVKSSNPQDINMPLLFATETPLESIDKKGVRLLIKNDTIWTPAEEIELTQLNDFSLLQYKADFDWTPEAEYRLEIDSAAITDIYGLHNKAIKQEFKVRPQEDYSTLVFNVNAPDNAFIELLTSDDKVFRTSPIINGKAIFEYLMPQTYYARLVIDRNNNGKFDTGNYAKKIQPEDVYYYPKKINLKKNWEIEQEWNINSLPVDMQKPSEIKKNKPELTPLEKERLKKQKGDGHNHENEEEEDAFGKNIFDQNNNQNPFNQNNYNR